MRRGWLKVFPTPSRGRERPADKAWILQPWSAGRRRRVRRLWSVVESEFRSAFAREVAELSSRAQDSMAGIDALAA